MVIKVDHNTKIPRIVAHKALILVQFIALLFLSSAPPEREIVWEGPIVITDAVARASGGYFHDRHWKSGQAGVPAVQIATSIPLHFDRCSFMSSSWAGIANVLPDGQEAYTGIDLTVTNCRGFEGPRVEEQKGGGRFLRLRNPRRLRFEHNEVAGTQGLYIHGVLIGEGTELYIGKNRFRDVNGNFKTLEPNQGRSFEVSNLVQLNECVEVPKVLIERNYFYSRPGMGVEDAISIYGSSGTTGSPLTIRYNFLRGAHNYPLNALDPKNRKSFQTGSGIMIEAGASSKSVPQIKYPHNIHVYENYVVETNNAGINLFAGYDNLVENNTIICSGRYQNATDSVAYPDGTKYMYGSAGLCLNNYKGYTPTKWFYNNRIRNNKVAYARHTFSSGAHLRKDCCNNTLLVKEAYTALFPDREITMQDENDAEAEWFRRYAAGHTIGVTP